MYYCQYSKPLKLPITHMSNLLNRIVNGFQKRKNERALIVNEFYNKTLYNH